MKNTIQNNLTIYDQQYDWAKDGEEWDGQARFCHQSYDEWKKSLVETFLAPKHFLEFGCVGDSSRSRSVVERNGKSV